jgi:hypothetical protein
MAKLVAFSVSRAWLVIGVSLVLAVLAGVYASGHFKMTTDTEQLISDKLPWRQNGIAFEKTFP